LKTHPDKNKHTQAGDAFKRVAGAFQALETREKGRRYASSHNGQGFDLNEEDERGFHGFNGSEFGFEFNVFDFIFRSQFARSSGRGNDLHESKLILQKVITNLMLLISVMMMMMFQEMMNNGGGLYEEEGTDVESDCNVGE
jgi:DnaJ-class molecular chaperone